MIHNKEIDMHSGHIWTQDFAGAVLLCHLDNQDLIPQSQIFNFEIKSIKE